MQLSIPNLPPMKVRDGSTIKMTAAEVSNMAHNSIVEIEQQRREAEDQTLKLVMMERCEHRIPVLGWKYASHKKWPNEKLARQYSPELRATRGIGWGDEATCKTLKLAADWLIKNRPLEEQVMNITMEDFSALAPLKGF